MDLQRNLVVGVVMLTSIALTPAAALAQARCDALPDHAALKAALTAIVDEDNAGLGNEMWATVVNRDGVVCAVVFSGEDRADQWLGSRVISAQKANTALSFSLPGDAGFGGALSSGNLYGMVQPGGSLFGSSSATRSTPRSPTTDQARGSVSRTIPWSVRRSAA